MPGQNPHPVTACWPGFWAGMAKAPQLRQSRASITPNWPSRFRPRFAHHIGGTEPAECGDSGAGIFHEFRRFALMPDVAKVVPSRRSEVPVFMVMDVMATAARIEAAGGGVIHMEVGQPAAPAPSTALAAAHAALAGPLRYTEALGIRSLRERIARHYADTYGVAVDADRVVITTGSSAGVILSFLALFEPGDRVAVAVPGYPPYRLILTALGCEPVMIETSAETRWAITPEMLIAAHRSAPLKGVLIASPANPTGTMMTGQALRDLIAAAEGEGIRFISDELYHGLDY